MFGLGIIYRFIGRVLAVVLGIMIVNKLKSIDWDDEKKYILFALVVLILIFAHILYSGRPVVHVG